MSSIKELVEYVAKSLADQPEAVHVIETTGDAAVLIELHVDAEDMGRLIGRRGRTINALRSVARVLGGKMEKRVEVEIMEAEETE